DGAIGKQPFSGAQRKRIDLEPQLIDQIMLEERLKEICTSVNVQIRPCLLLELADFFRNVSAQKYGGLPFARRHAIRGDVLGRCHRARPDVRMMRPERFPNFKGFAAITADKTACSSVYSGRFQSHRQNRELATRHTRSHHWYLRLARLRLG